MPSNKNGKRPDAPTRLAEETRTNPGDRFKTRVYYVPETDLFLTFDSKGEPVYYDWVVVELHDGNLAVELYDGQQFVGVATILNFWKLKNSEQWRPRIQNRFTNWCMLLLTALASLAGA